MENVLQIHTEAVSAQIAHFYEVCILIIALLGPVQRQTSYKRLTYITSQLPFLEKHFLHKGKKVEYLIFIFLRDPTDNCFYDLYNIYSATFIEHG